MQSERTQQAKQAAKQTYAKPQVVKHGNVEQLTQGSRLPTNSSSCPPVRKLVY